MNADVVRRCRRPGSHRPHTFIDLAADTDYQCPGTPIATRSLPELLARRPELAGIGITPLLEGIRAS